MFVSLYHCFYFIPLWVFLVICLFNGAAVLVSGCYEELQLCTVGRMFQARAREGSEL